MQSYRTLVFAIAGMAVAATGCETTRTSTSPAAQASQAQADRFMRDRQYANAAHVYADLAEHATAETRDPLLLRAAHAWLRAEDLPRGENLLQQVGDKVPGSDATLLRLTMAEAALLERRPERTL